MSEAQLLYGTSIVYTPWFPRSADYPDLTRCSGWSRRYDVAVRGWLIGDRCRAIAGFLILLLVASQATSQTELRPYPIDFGVAIPTASASDAQAKIANVRNVLSRGEQFSLNGPQLPASTLSDFGIVARFCVMGQATFDTTIGSWVPFSEAPLLPVLIARSPPAAYDHGSGKILFSPYVWCDSYPSALGLNRGWIYAESYVHELRHCAQSAGETIVTPFDPEPSPGGMVGGSFAVLSNHLSDICQIIRELDAYGTTFDFYLASVTSGGALPLDDLALGAHSAEVQVTLLKTAYEKHHGVICQALSDLSQETLSQVEEQLAEDYLKARLIKEQHYEAARDYVMARIEEFKAL